MSRTCEAVLFSYISDVVIEPINSYVHLCVNVYVYVYVCMYVFMYVGGVGRSGGVVSGVNGGIVSCKID